MSAPPSPPRSARCERRCPTFPEPGTRTGGSSARVRSLNVWLSLSRHGDVAPSLDIVPRRFDGLVVTETEGTKLDYQVSQAVAEEAAGEAGTVRPIFEPGDALLFDDLFLHQTGSDPSMPSPWYSIESWFFGPSSYPTEDTPLALEGPVVPEPQPNAETKRAFLRSLQIQHPAFTQAVVAWTCEHPAAMYRGERFDARSRLSGPSPSCSTCAGRATPSRPRCSTG